jgi:hypothetical protein
MQIKDSADQKIQIFTTTEIHIKYAKEICDVISEASKVEGTGIAKRNPEYIEQKIKESKAVIALSTNSDFAGFCYIESWGAKRDFVANSGLVIVPKYRNFGLGKMIKEKTFQLSRKKFPEAKMFGITTSPAVMKINYFLGYHPVTFDHLTNDEEFWKGCESCTNYDILQRTNNKHCLCTAMLFNPSEKIKIKNMKESEYEKESSLSV